MTDLLNTLLPACLVLFMVGLGLALTVEDFLRLKERKRVVFIGSLCQLVLLPAIAFLIARTFSVSPELAVGIVLVAACPSGPSSNFFCLIAGADLALSATLTAFASLFTVFSIPFVVNLALSEFGQSTVALTLPILPAIQNISLLVLLPMAIGMLIRFKAPTFAERCRLPVRRAALVFLLAIIVLLTVKHVHRAEEILTAVGLPILVLLFSTMLLGDFVSRYLQLQRKERLTITIEIGIQNAAQAMTIASSPLLLNNSLMATPALLYGITMYVFVFGYLFLMRQR